MCKMYEFVPKQTNKDVLLPKRTVRLASNLISLSDSEIEVELAQDHAADPIKSMDDIMRISRYLISKGRYRDNMMFIVGINFGLRISDLRMLRFSNIINNNLTFKDKFPVFEKKTRNTRKRKKNRYITINNAVREAVTLYLENTDRKVEMNDYMFISESNRGKNLGEPIQIRSVNQIFEKLANELGLNIHFSTHSLRKTFCYHQMLMSRNDPRKLLLLQKMLGHSSPAQTLDYIGITEDEMEEAYLRLNLGSETDNYLMDSTIGETEALIC